MKRIVEITFLISILSIFAGCSQENGNENLNQPPSNSADCFYTRGFVETYRDAIAHDEIFFVKGEVTASGRYGKNVKIIEDIKGNFKETPSITLWNHWEFGVADLNCGVGGRMLVLMSKIGGTSDSWTKQRIGDYCTMDCSVSTLLFSDRGEVTGFINTHGEKITVPWKELQELLSSSCRSNRDFVETFHANIGRENVFFIKGTVMTDERFSCGIKIKPVKDLKGNFEEDASIVVWGKGDLSNSIDSFYPYITDQSHGAYSLYMLIEQIVSADVPYSDRRKGDYATIDCACSVIPVNLTEQYLGNGEFVRVGGEWMTGEEFEERFSVQKQVQQ
ncbi:MAG: hypothetical protein LBM08_05565 [Dysgonamonadaceae bacterium]|jgi:hypothetical protein|nr:hypothetical protein [Dysgonamonadaceae bacterium]